MASKRSVWAPSLELCVWSRNLKYAYFVVMGAQVASSTAVKVPNHNSGFRLRFIIECFLEKGMSFVLGIMEYIYIYIHIYIDPRHYTHSPSSIQ